MLLQLIRDRDKKAHSMSGQNGTHHLASHFNTRSRKSKDVQIVGAENITNNSVLVRIKCLYT